MTFQAKLRKYFSMNLKLFQALAEVNVLLNLKMKLVLGRQKGKKFEKIYTHMHKHYTEQLNGKMDHSISIPFPLQDFNCFRFILVIAILCPFNYFFQDSCSK